MANRKGVPQYHRIVDDMRWRIESGELPPGARLPTQDELAEQYGVGRGVVDRAFRVLIERGLIETNRGGGTFVADREPTDVFVADREPAHMFVVDGKPTEAEPVPAHPYSVHVADRDEAHRRGLLAGEAFVAIYHPDPSVRIEYRSAAHKVFVPVPCERCAGVGSG